MPAQKSRSTHPVLSRWPLSLLLASVTSVSCQPTNQVATTVLTGGKIYTLDAAHTQATALALQGRTILYVGNDFGARAYVGDETVEWDLAGQVVLPGFHDAHAHLIWSAADLLNVDLFETSTVEELQAAIKQWADAHPDAEWIQGGGWNLADFEGDLNAGVVDAVESERPALLYSSDGHSALVNSRALALANITAETEDPEDGRIERDEDGNPTGLLQESAMDLVAELAPGYPTEQLAEGLTNGQLEANSVGITTTVDASVEDWIMEGYAVADEAGLLTVRVHGAGLVHPGDPDNLSRLNSMRQRRTSDRLMLDQAKFFIDGVIETQTAYMIRPYEDGSNGTPNFSDAELKAAALELDAAGYQLHAHTIGDGAVRQFLDALEAVEQANGVQDRRPMLSHIEVVDPADMPRFAALGAYANAQMLWAYPDPYITDLTWPVIGEQRSENLYPFGALVEAGATLVAGSDWSVSTMNPWEAIEVAVSRQDPYESGGEVLTPQHTVERLTAIRAYTSEGAKATRTEATLGTLEVGKWADFIVLDRNPFEIPVVELSDVQVLQTWLDGQVVYDAERMRAQLIKVHAPARPRTHGDDGCLRAPRGQLPRNERTR
ncbi:MAG: amidohydrolase [Myxococcota bacterium]